MFGPNVDARIYQDARSYEDARIEQDAYEPDASVDAREIDAPTQLTCSSTSPIPIGSADSDTCTETLFVNGCTGVLTGPCQVELGSGGAAFAVMESSITCGYSFPLVPCSSPTATRVTCPTANITCGSGSE
jgi:hypothetical protein